MTPDRKDLLQHVWEVLYKHTCPCGRCDCVSADPVQIARRVFAGWATALRRTSHHEQERADIYRRSETKMRRLDFTSEGDRCAACAARHERLARHFKRASVRFERLASGKHPFVPHTETERDGGAS